MHQYLFPLKTVVLCVTLFLSSPQEKNEEKKSGVLGWLFSFLFFFLYNEWERGFKLGSLHQRHLPRSHNYTNYEDHNEIEALQFAHPQMGQK